MTTRTPSILVLGLGISGLSMARWVARNEGDTAVRVADTRVAPPNLPALQSELPGAEFVSGPFAVALLEGIRTVLVSPGLAPHEIQALLDEARARDLQIIGELGLFAQALNFLAEEGERPRLLAVTGTNGKTTVTSLTSQLVERAGLTVATAGNIGPAMLDVLTDRMDTGTLPKVWVLELSSFQLHRHDNSIDFQNFTAFEPTAATVLNLTQDHLDWHGDMNAYAAAKARIFGERGVMVLNRDDAAVMAMRPAPPAKVAKGMPKPEPRTVVTFGAGMPTEPGDFGIEQVGGMAWLVRALEADETQRRRKDAVEEMHFQRLMPADALRIRGRHNAVNALAALALATSAGCALGPMLYGLREYRGEPHRVESIGLLDGVEYFDDSKGTNVGATVAALEGLGAERKLVLILGGDGKGQDFSPLAAPVARYVRAAVLIGRDAALVRAAIGSAGVPMLDASDMNDAVAQARERAQPGDAVLLSPACASLDMYKNYGERAEVFRAAVRDLALAAGTELEVL